jgi:hypothetical protein
MPLEGRVDSATLNSESQQEVCPEALRLSSLSRLSCPLVGESARGISDVLSTGTNHGDSLTEEPDCPRNRPTNLEGASRGLLSGGPHPQCGTVCVECHLAGPILVDSG